MPLALRYLSILLLALMPIWAGAGPAIVLSTGDWPPYTAQQAADGGVVARIVSAAFALEGITVTYRFASWTRAIHDAREGAVDGSIIWRHDAERASSFLYSDPVFEGRTVLFHLESTPFDWTGIEDLYKISVGGTVGYRYQFEPNPIIHIDRAATDEIGFRKLLGGRFPVFISDVAAGRAVLREHFSAAEAQRVTSHARPVQITAYFLILPRKLAASGALMASFNRGLARLRASGRYAELFAPAAP